MNTNKIKTWIAEQKGALILGAVSAVSIGILGYFGVKSHKSTGSVLGTVSGIKDLNIKLDKATVTKAWTEPGGVRMCLHDFQIRDIGELGKDLIKNVPNVTADSALACVLGICDES